MDPKVLKRVVKRAQDDPQLLHALIFDPEKAIAELDFLDRNAKSAILSREPEEIITSIVGERIPSAAIADYAP